MVMNKDLYTEMQKRYYEDPSKNTKSIVGNYDFHEDFPYETYLLYEYGDVRKPIFNDFQDRLAFDICCGEGRMVRRMNKVFKRCDGCDISEKMLNAAKEQTPQSHFYLSNGQNVGGGGEIYDFMYCTISLQHICSYTIRKNIIQSALYKLNTDGKITLQMLYSSYYPYIHASNMITDDFMLRMYRKDKKHALYFEDRYDAKSTNSGCDVVISEDQILSVINDFKNYFRSVKIWFHDISIGRGNIFNNNHPNSHSKKNYHGTHFIFIHGAEKIL